MNRSDARPSIAWLLCAVFSFGAALAPVAAQTAAQTQQQPAIPPVSAVVRPDTVLHALGGMMAGMLAASAASRLESTVSIRQYPLFLPAVGFSAALAAGMAKETLDSTGFGDPQWSDLFHTMIGGLIVAGLIAAVELSPAAGSSRAQSGAYAVWGAGLAIPVGAAFAEEIHRYLAKRRSEK